MFIQEAQSTDYMKSTNAQFFTAFDNSHFDQLITELEFPKLDLPAQGNIKEYSEQSSIKSNQGFGDLIDILAYDDCSVYNNKSENSEVNWRMDEQQIINNEDESHQTQKTKEKLKPSLNLKDLSKTYEIDRQFGKATNVPKFLVKTTFQTIYSEIPYDRGYKNHKEYLQKWHQVNSKEVFNRQKLTDLFGVGNSQTHNWNELHRKILQNRLREERKELFLDNNMVPLANKHSYLYNCKIYEWRLNDGHLTGCFK